MQLEAYMLKCKEHKLCERTMKQNHAKRNAYDEGTISSEASCV